MMTYNFFEAFDGNTFRSEDECYAYEEKIADYIGEVVTNIHFFDENGNQMKPEDNRYFDVWVDFVEAAFDECTTLKVVKPLSEEVADWVDSYFGYNFPEEEGLYNYEEDDWKKADE